MRWMLYWVKRKVNPLRALKSIRWFFQRGRRGWADCDVWDLDHYLAKVIGGSVHRLAAVDHGWPQSEVYPTYDDFVDDLCRIACAFEQYTRLEEEHAVEFDKVWSKKRWNDLTPREKVLVNETYARSEKKQAETLAEMKRIFDIWTSLWD